MRFADIAVPAGGACRLPRSAGERIATVLALQHDEFHLVVDLVFWIVHPVRLVVLIAYGATLVDTARMDQTPSLRRALVGLALVIAAIAGGYLLLKSASDRAGDDGTGGGGGPNEVVRFVRSGGFVGETHRLVLHESGRGTLHGQNIDKPGVSIDIGKRRLDGLVEQLDEVWPEERDTINDPNACADCYQYDITYDGVRVTLFGIVPDRFKKPIQELSGIVERNRGRP